MVNYGINKIFICFFICCYIFVYKIEIYLNLYKFIKFKKINLNFNVEKEKNTLSIIKKDKAYPNFRINNYLCGILLNALI